MKIDVQIAGLDETYQMLMSIGKDGKKLFNKIIRRLAIEYKKFVVRGYLSGQYLGVRTGKTQQSMIAYKDRAFVGYTVASRIQNRDFGFAGLANIYEYPGGVDIKPRNTEVLRFPGSDGSDVYTRGPVHLNPRPFMSDSSRAFPFAERFMAITNDVIATYAGAE